MAVEEQFRRRAQVVPRLGFGLSVDVYSPDVFELMSRFQGQPCRPSYLEIFRAHTAALQALKRHLTGVPLAYHGEGLWITQPDFPTQPFLGQQLSEVTSELSTLESPWLNHECATKQMSGYSFGTYLPPLYTAESAVIVADNIGWVQERLDHGRGQGETFGPLFLLEMPPLTYFMAGTIGVPEYFRLVTERTPCGLVLDIGHIWTVFRYTAGGSESSLERFVERFLDEFPLERVIEIHIAGLSMHEAACVETVHDDHPEWIDAHAAPIPTVSWMMLEQVLAHPRLAHLRAVALEVDTKPPDLIVEEFVRACASVRPTVERLLEKDAGAVAPCVQPLRLAPRTDQLETDRQRLESDYIRYARIVSGQEPPAGASWQAVAGDSSGLERYIHAYLPHEILHWGGELTDMFPETCKGLDDQGVALNEFVPWWFERPRPADRPYDFFLLKVDRLVEFVAERAPMLIDVARREAETLRLAYEDANAASGRLTEACS